MKTDKIILGIDPGTTIMGYGIIHIKGSDMHLIQMGVLHLSKLNSHELTKVCRTAHLLVLQNNNRSKKENNK